MREISMGVQRRADLKGKIPFTDISAEFGVNGGAIVDAGEILSGSSRFLRDVGSVITGTRHQGADE